MDSQPTVTRDAVVRIAVRMFDMQGNLLEETEAGGVEYLHGHQDIFPRIEQALEGSHAGQTVSVILDPEDAFGEFDEYGLAVVPVESLADPELVVPGLVFDHVPGFADDGRRWRVSDVAQGKAVLDSNHPLAGWTLRFEVTVLSVGVPQDADTVGNDEVVVPGFLGFADKIIDEDA